MPARGTETISAPFSEKTLRTESCHRKYFVKRECSGDSDCTSEQYCGSDFKCHEHKVINNTFVEHNYMIPALIVAFGLIGAAVILRYKRK